MNDLILLYIDDEEPVRCLNIEDAKQKVCSRNRIFSDALVETTPEGGGPVISYRFNRSEREFVAYE